MLPGSDSLQNATGRLDEFLFGFLTGKAGSKRVSSADECEAIRRGRIRPSRTALLHAAYERALALEARLKSEPGLTREALAREMDVSRACITQILRKVNRRNAERRRWGVSSRSLWG